MAVQAISYRYRLVGYMKAKRAGLPLAKLLGAHRDSVPCYNTSGVLCIPLDQVLKKCGDFRENGIGGIKLKGVDNPTALRIFAA